MVARCGARWDTMGVSFRGSPERPERMKLLDLINGNGWDMNGDIYIYINYIIIIYIYTNTQLEAKLDDVLWYFTITNIGGWSSIFPAVPVYSYHDLFLVDFIYYPNYILCAMGKSWIASGLRLPRSEGGRWPLYPCRFPTILCSRSSSLSITDHLPMSLQYFLCPFGLVVNFEGIFGGCVGWLCRWFKPERSLSELAPGYV
jgi:hypothetical protein